MAAMSNKQRRKLPASAYVYKPGTAVGGKRGAYPITTVKQARNALVRAAQPRTKGTYATVARAVKARYGSKVASVGGPRGRVSQPGLSPRRRGGKR